MNKTQQKMRWSVLLSGPLYLFVAGLGCSEPDQDLQSIGSDQARHSAVRGEKRPSRSVRGEWLRSPNQHAQVPPSETSGGSAAGATGDGTNAAGGTGGQNSSDAGTTSTGQTGSGQDHAGTGSGAKSAEKTGAGGEGLGQATGPGQGTGTEAGTSQRGVDGNQGSAQGQAAGPTGSGRRDQAHSGSNAASANAGRSSSVSPLAPGDGKPESGKPSPPARSQSGEKPDPAAGKSTEPQGSTPKQAGLQPGREAGNLTGQDGRKIDSPERSMFPKRASGEGREQRPKETVERDSFEFTNPTTQQAERMMGASSRYERNGAGDLSVMKVPPAKRQLIRNYFRNLRSVSTNQPASAPAFSQSQPEG